MVKTVDEIWRAQRADSPATILAIGTAVPPNVYYQSEFPDWYFRVTKSEHKTNLKQKFKRMCEGTTIEKRYMHLTEEMLLAHPNIYDDSGPSMDARQDIVVDAVPRLGQAAAAKAIKEWGHPKSSITHLVFHSICGVDMPGSDYKLTRLLGLPNTVKRVMLYQQGCFAGGTVLRVAKDLAENNRGARVLVVCAEVFAMVFNGPSEARLDGLVGQALFGDGAAALVVGADPDPETERPLFQIVSAASTVVPESDGAIQGHVRESGLTFHLVKDVPKLISGCIKGLLEAAFGPLGVRDWNSIFWVAHPGGRLILDKVEELIGLKEERLRVTRDVLREYGNMSSACVLFIMDEMRRRSAAEGKGTTGEGLELGVLFGFGPGLTVETVVLRSFLLFNMNLLPDLDGKRFILRLLMELGS